MSEKLSKYIATFDYFDKAFIAFNFFNLEQVEKCLLFFLQVLLEFLQEKQGQVLFFIFSGYRNNKESIRNNKK